MKKNNSSFILLAMLMVLSIYMAGCKKNFDNPNAATQEQVYNSAKGLTGTAIGLQRIYSLGLTSTIYNLNTAVGFTTNEVTLRNAGNIPELQLSTGGPTVDGTNAVLANLWINSNKIIYDANNVIAKAEQLSDKGYASGLIGYTSIWKALSLGALSMNWEKVPDTIGANVTFSDRVKGFNTAVTVIDKAFSGYSCKPNQCKLIRRYRPHRSKRCKYVICPKSKVFLVCGKLYGGIGRSKHGRPYSQKHI